jgi:hypothetical protein
MWGFETEPEFQAEEMERNVALERGAEPSEVIGAALFLAREASS